METNELSAIGMQKNGISSSAFISSLDHDAPVPNRRQVVAQGNSVSSPVTTGLMITNGSHRISGKVLFKSNSQPNASPEMPIPLNTKYPAQPNKSPNFSSELYKRPPLQILNETCVKANAKVQMDFNMIGPPHAPSFHCILSVAQVDGGVLHAAGVGRQKQEAKQEAARAFLVDYANCPSEIMTDPVALKTVSQPSQPASQQMDDELLGNPIGELINLCMKLKISQPRFEELEEVAEPGRYVFKSACYISPEFSDIGIGTSKKNSKRAAANKVLQSLLKKMATNMKDIEDIAEHDMVDAGGNPIGDLINLCMKLDFPAPKFVESTETVAEGRYAFQSICTVTEEFCDTGNGTSKKMAKRSSAQKVLEKLLKAPKTKADKVEVLPRPEVMNVEGNPIGDLVELCAKLGISPQFKDLRESGTENNYFEKVCYLTPEFSGTGAGTTPKMAKKASAFKLLEKIRSILETKAENIEEISPEDELDLKLNTFVLKNAYRRAENAGNTLSTGNSPNGSMSKGAALVDASTSTCSTLLQSSPSRKSIRETISFLKLLKGKNFEQLINMKTADFLKCDHMALWKDIMLEQKFEHELIDLPIERDRQEHKSLISFIIDDTRIGFMVAGNSTTAARKAGVTSALEYLRLARLENF